MPRRNIKYAEVVILAASLDARNHQSRRNMIRERTSFRYSETQLNSPVVLLKKMHKSFTRIEAYLRITVVQWCLFYSVWVFHSGAITTPSIKLGVVMAEVPAKGEGGMFQLDSAQETVDQDSKLGIVILTEFEESY